MRFSWKDYQDAAKEFIEFDKSKGIKYCALGLGAEAAELWWGLPAKVLRGDNIDTPVATVKEIGDCLWMVANLCRYIDVDFEEVMTHERFAYPPENCGIEFAKNIVDHADSLIEASTYWRTQLILCFVEQLKVEVERLGMYKMEEIALMNIIKLIDRRDRGVIKGNGDER